MLLVFWLPHATASASGSPSPSTYVAPKTSANDRYFGALVALDGMVNQLYQQHDTSCGSPLDSLRILPLHTSTCVHALEAISQAQLAKRLIAVTPPDGDRDLHAQLEHQLTTVTSAAARERRDVAHPNSGAHIDSHFDVATGLLNAQQTISSLQGTAPPGAPGSTNIDLGGGLSDTPIYVAIGLAVAGALGALLVLILGLRTVPDETPELPAMGHAPDISMERPLWEIRVSVAQAVKFMERGQRGGLYRQLITIFVTVAATGLVTAVVDHMYRKK